MEIYLANDCAECDHLRAQLKAATERAEKAEQALDRCDSDIQIDWERTVEYIEQKFGKRNAHNHYEIIDWVAVELRSATERAEKAEERVSFLYNDQHADKIEFQDDIAGLEAQLAEARKDTERWNAVEQGSLSVQRRSGVPNSVKPWAILFDSVPIAVGDTPRAAIDAAILNSGSKL